MEQSKELRVTEGRVVAEPLGGRGVESKKMKVLVAVDESEMSLYALSWALDRLFPPAIAGETQERETLERLIIVHAQQPYHNFTQPVGPSIYPITSVLDSVKKAQRQIAAHVLNKAIEVCKERQVKAETMTVEGDPKDVICQTVEGIHPDLLVVGNRGLGAIKRAFLGSVSDYCAHHAKCPVLIVKPPKASE